MEINKTKLQKDIDFLFLEALKGNTQILSNFKVAYVKKIIKEQKTFAYTTPLHMLAFLGYKEALKHPASIHLRDSNGLTPIQKFYQSQVAYLKQQTLPPNFNKNWIPLTLEDIKNLFPWYSLDTTKTILNANLLNTIINTPRTLDPLNMDTFRL